jgi:hypothetical protein
MKFMTKHFDFIRNLALIVFEFVDCRSFKYLNMNIIYLYVLCKVVHPCCSWLLRLELTVNKRVLLRSENIFLFICGRYVCSINSIFYALLSIYYLFINIINTYYIFGLFISIIELFRHKVNYHPINEPFM